MTSGQAGKGDKYRPVDKEKFDRNFDRIFKPSKSKKTKKK